MNPPRGAKKFLIGRDLHGGLSLPEGASFFRGRPVLRVDTLFAKIVLIGIAPQELAGTDCRRMTALGSNRSTLKRTLLKWPWEPPWAQRSNPAWTVSRVTRYVNCKSQAAP